jgi:hypothetical protein
MAVSVTLGATPWSWRLDGESAIDDWMRRRPWQTSGSILAVQTPREHGGIEDYLARTAYAADAATSELRIARLQVDRQFDLRADLSAWMGIQVGSWRSLMQALTDDLMARPTLFLVAVAENANIDATVDAASELVDHTSKGGSERGPAILLLHRYGHAPLRGTCRLDRGWPAGLADECIERPLPEAWRAYLHVRIAWETGGQLDDASACDSMQNPEVPVGDDDALERQLATFARRQFAGMPEHERQAWTRHGAAPGARPTVFGQEPAMASRLTPFPWLARALLIGGRSALGVRPLRAELVCRPLAERVLMICFLAETRLREQIPDRLVGIAPPDAQQTFQMFQAGTSLESEIYPRSHPARPSDVWDFASMGTLLPLVGQLPPSSRRLFDRAKRLRNAVAHGHNVGWQAILRAREVADLMRHA